MIVKTLIEKHQGKIPKGKRRSSRWSKTRKLHLETNPRCFLCESKKSLEVHHVEPFHERPDLELEPSNLLTLCENKKYGVNCHLLFGHLGNYRRVNRNVVRDCIYWNSRIKKKYRPKKILPIIHPKSV